VSETLAHAIRHLRDQIGDLVACVLLSPRRHRAAEEERLAA
jgi:hypothetical protein